MIAVLFVVAVIVYGTLYPWDFQPNPQASLGRLLRSYPPYMSRRVLVDAVTNFLMYIPLGLTLFLLIRKGMSRVVAAFLTVAAGCALSFSLEYAQYFQRTRFPTLLDVLTNTMGTAAGVALAGMWSRWSLSWRTPAVTPMLLWAAWIVSMTFPLIPTFGIWVFRSKVRALVSFELVTFIGFALQWLIASVLLAKRRPHWIGATFLLIAAQLFFVGRQPTVGMIAGALAGSALALLPLRPAGAALAALLLLVLWELAPFRLRAPQAFGWIPLADAMEASGSASVAIVLAKTFSYGGCIAMLVRGGLGFASSVAAVAVLLSVTEFAQMWITGRTATATDPVLAVLSATVLWHSRGRVS